MSGAQQYSLWLGLGTAAMVLLLVVAEVVVICVSRSSFTDVRSFQMLGMTVVLGLAVVALAVGWDGTQLAVTAGLFGAALGYLFGRQVGPPESGQGQVAPPPQPPPS